MYYFFFGENTYLISEKIESLKENFLKTDSSGMNISEVDGSVLNYSKYKSLISTMPFLAPKRLIFIKNLLQNNDNDLKKKIAAEIEKISESTILVFIEFGSPDQRSVLFKALNKPKIAQKFDPLSGASFRNWVSQKLKENNAFMDQNALFLFEQYLLGDMWRAENELTKLVLYKKALSSDELIKIDSADIEKMVAEESQSNIFGFIDALSNKNAAIATKAFDKLIIDGLNELYILTMIIYQYRNMLIVSDLLSRRQPQSEIPKITKLHPFVIKKTLTVLRKYNQNQLENIYFTLQDSDYKIKRGELEAKIALPRLIQKLTTNFTE